MESTNEIQHDQNHKGFAGFWIRTGAYLIDGIIIGVPLSIISFIVFAIFIGTSDVFHLMMKDSMYEINMTDAEALSFLGAYCSALLVTSLISFIGSVAYFAGLHSSKWQATIGKKLLGLKVIDLKDNRISFWRAFGRYAAMSFLSGILLIGYIMVAFTEKKQGLHDLIAGTLVVKNK